MREYCICNFLKKTKKSSLLPYLCTAYFNFSKKMLDSNFSIIFMNP